MRSFVTAEKSNLIGQIKKGGRMMSQYKPEKHEVSNKYIITIQIVIVLFFTIILLTAWYFLEKRTPAEQDPPNEPKTEDIIAVQKSFKRASV